MNIDQEYQRRLKEISCDRCPYSEHCLLYNDPDIVRDEMGDEEFEEWQKETFDECKWEQEETAAYDNAVDAMVDAALGK